MAKIQPIGDRVLVEPIEKEKTEGGLMLSNIQNHDEPKTGKVLAVGEGVTLDTGEVKPLAVNVGDTVIFNPVSAINVMNDGVKCNVITIRDIYGKELK